MLNSPMDQKDVSSIPAAPDFTDIEHGPLNNNQR